MGLYHAFIGTWIYRRARTLPGVFQILCARWDGDAAREQGRCGVLMLLAPVPNGAVIAEVWGWGGHRCSHLCVMESLGGAQGTAWSTKAAKGSADVVQMSCMCSPRHYRLWLAPALWGHRGKKIRVCSGNSIRRIFVCPCVCLSPSCPHTAALSLWINTLVKH